MQQPTLETEDLEADAAEFYGDVTNTLRDAGIPFLVGGGFAFSTYSGIARDTKDLDIFVLPSDVTRVLEVLAQTGYETENKFPHWLAKAYCGGRLVDIIFSSGNGVCPVDEDWFTHATPAILLGQDVRLMPPEEMIWQKAFIMERHRFDGADVINLFHACQETLNWNRLLRRFDSEWLVLFSHLLLYRFVYPGDHSQRVTEILQRLAARLQNDLQTAEEFEPGKMPLCRGTLLSLLEYLPAIEQWGYRDARLLPEGALSAAEVEHWTNSFER